MAHEADVAVIGAGISGLVDAILLAETGRRVVVLEQHVIPGGYLQQFGRKGTTFDVGFHYMGSTEPGRPMRQMLEHLRVWDRMALIPFPEDAAIVVRNGAQLFAYPSRWSRFREVAGDGWPHEREALDGLLDEVEDIAAAYKWFALRRGVDYLHPRDLPFATHSFDEQVTPMLTDPWLREVLSFQTFNLGLYGHEIPWTKHALAFRSNFDTTCRIDGGGGALVDALVARGRELGVEYHFGAEVTRVVCQDRQVRALETAAGDSFEAGLFVAACHPKPILRCIDDRDMRPLFKQRVLDMKDSRGAVQIWLRLSALPTSLGASCLMLRDEAEEHGDPPLGTILVTCPSAVEPATRGGPRLEAMTYMDHEPFARWKDTPVMRRGEDYERFKTGLARRMLGMIARVAPEVPDLVQDMYVATPLTDAWYTKAEHGAVFGISHDVTQQGSNRPMPRMRLRNLFFTGHSITMPGICGTFINAFDTCDLLREDGVLFDAIAT